MTTKLTKELAAALRATGDPELDVVGPKTSRVYVIVDGEIHQQTEETLRPAHDRDAIVQGIAEMEAGMGVSADEVFASIRKDLGLGER